MSQVTCHWWHITEWWQAALLGAFAAIVAMLFRAALHETMRSAVRHELREAEDRKLEKKP